MNPFLSFVLRSFIAGPAAVVIWLVSYFGADLSAILSSGVAIGGSLALFWMLGFLWKNKFLKKHGVTRKEYKYIKKNLDEAKGKISRLQKSAYSIKHLPTIKQRFELVRLVKKINSIVKKDPKRFYQAERFYFSHLDSVLELTEKYAFLASQPKKNRDISEALADTRWTLEDLTRTVEQDLYEILSDDVENLNFEIDVAKNTLKTERGSRLETVRPIENVKTDESVKVRSDKGPFVSFKCKQETSEQPKTRMARHEKDEKCSNGKKEPEAQRFFINTDTTPKSKVGIPVRPADAGKSEKSRRL
ncbi:5-bromo-4-chloroindolyl phosphate hydrolysis family protein [Bacillus massilinigeriensis]|uniref:5-bromo-4-chloroindolyl phosphate hydrolysis family protein n=1 Tax=Bacillus mediterraneensis TaxID=1805474 RepID=UPI0008F87557|nr:5-bromo-4-chloroindolyl phosphate hydrolysis family protein [Bacillus mediterraneensis]